MRAHNNYQNWIIKSVLLCCVIALLTGIFIINPLFAYAEYDNGDIIVYRTKTGYAYHVDGCYHLKSKIEISLRDATNLGLTPCKDCNPPIFDGNTESSSYESSNSNGNTYSSNISGINSGSVIENGEVGVYITNSGSKYHRKNCSYLQSSKLITLKEAVDEKLTPCSRCNPPILGKASETDDDPYISSGNSYSYSSNSYSSNNQSNSNTSTNNSANDSVPYGLLGGVGVVAVGFAGFSAINNKRQREREEEERREKEEKLRNDRALFKADLNGQSIRDKAGVPSNIYFYEGYPKDNNNKKYGSYTVYVSNNGNCYHKTQGCCSARNPIHSFRAVNRYRPCSKCCDTSIRIPEWYNNYIRLYNTANKLEFDSNDPIFNTDRTTCTNNNKRNDSSVSKTTIKSVDSKKIVSITTDRTNINTKKKTQETRFVKLNEQKDIKQRSEKSNALKCPECGGILVVRTARRGPRPGSQFYGCSNYPWCKYTRNL